jgi:hypothetical protein
LHFVWEASVVAGVGKGVGDMVGKRVGISVGAHEKVQPSSFSFSDGQMQFSSGSSVSAVGVARNATSEASTKENFAAMADCRAACLSALERSTAVASISMKICTV